MNSKFRDKLLVVETVNRTTPYFLPSLFGLAGLPLLFGLAGTIKTRRLLAFVLCRPRPLLMLSAVCVKNAAVERYAFLGISRILRNVLLLVPPRLFVFRRYVLRGAIVK